ncbi:MAG TPA: hypothetical protein VJ258_03890 [Candidatus Limnocylindrales bacterium]|jgi:hypothetical protein|nr:hypothetical protein [Candidatus Limnocylindrales bacterium]
MSTDPNQTNPHEEPCRSCGEETAVGSIFFSDRHTVEQPDGTRSYLCSICVARLRGSGHDEELAGGKATGLSAMGMLNVPR